MIVSFVQRPSGLLQSGTFQLRTRGILQNPCQVEKNEAVHAKKTVCETGMAAGGSRRGENSKEFFGKRQARLRESRAIPRKAGHFWGKPGAAGDDAGQYRGKTGRGWGNRAPQCTGSSRPAKKTGPFDAARGSSPLPRRAILTHAGNAEASIPAEVLIQPQIRRKSGGGRNRMPIQ